MSEASFSLCLSLSKSSLEVYTCIFRSMGGRVIPGRRPGHIVFASTTVDRNNIIMDFENECLSQHWSNTTKTSNGILETQIQFGHGRYNLKRILIIVQSIGMDITNRN